jgi:hypothetical protein
VVLALRHRPFDPAQAADRSRSALVGRDDAPHVSFNLITTLLVLAWKSQLLAVSN